MRSCIRKTDILIRYGGDEFLLLFPRMTEEVFLDKKKQIQQAVRGIRMSEFADVQLSVSIGGICGVHPITEAIRKADYLMYLDKAGRSPEEVKSPAGRRKSVPGREFAFFQAAAARRSLRKGRGSAAGPAQGRVFNFALPRFSTETTRQNKIDLDTRRISHSDRIALCGIVQTLRRIGGIVGKFIGGTLGIRYNEHAVLLLIERAGERVFLLLFTARGRGRRRRCCTGILIFGGLAAAGRKRCSQQSRACKYHQCFFM